MSFSVLVIPEDPQQNGHILKPLVRSNLAATCRQTVREGESVCFKTRGSAVMATPCIPFVTGTLRERYRLQGSLVVFSGCGQSQ